MIRVCNQCNIEKPDEQFYADATRNGGRQYSCKVCTGKRAAPHNARRRKERRLLLLAHMVSTGGCVDCGELDPIVLHFDHVRGIKEFSIADMVTYSMKRVWKEIEKCDVRCANCHTRKTALEQGWYS